MARVAGFAFWALMHTAFASRVAQSIPTKERVAWPSGEQCPVSSGKSVCGVREEAQDLSRSVRMPGVRCIHAGWSRTRTTPSCSAASRPSASRALAAPTPCSSAPRMSPSAGSLRARLIRTASTSRLPLSSRPLSRRRLGLCRALVRTKSGKTNGVLLTKMVRLRLRLPPTPMRSLCPSQETRPGTTPRLACVPDAHPRLWIFEMTEEIKNVDGFLGNFKRRRQIERDVAESKSVGRTRPRVKEITPGSALWNEAHSEERLVDEKG
jgi:hypothetical protein